MYTNLAQQQAQAEAWLESHKSELSDVPCPEQSYAERQGYEVLGQVLQDIAQDEAAQSDLWELNTSEDSILETCGHMNVLTLRHWRTPQAFDNTKAPVGDRFNPVGFRTHSKRTSAARAKFGIEFCYNKNGKVVSQRTAHKQASPEQALIAKQARIAAKLAKLDRKAAKRASK